VSHDSNEVVPRPSSANLPFVPKYDFIKPVLSVSPKAARGKMDNCSIHGDNVFCKVLIRSTSGAIKTWPNGTGEVLMVIFPANFSADRGLFDYWGDDVGELRFLWKYLQLGMTFLDVGAFHGVYSTIAARKLGDRSRIVAFEPSQRDPSIATSSQIQWD
jgi:hypothetical protein